MIPSGSQLPASSAAVTEQPSRTWKMDFDTGCITAKIDGLEAVKQAVSKILQTERFEYLAYSFDYGVELRNLVGKSPAFVQSELRRRISEALLQDSRVKALRDFQFASNGDAMVVRFTVESSAGTFEREVSVSV